MYFILPVFFSRRIKRSLSKSSRFNLTMSLMRNDVLMPIMNSSKSRPCKQRFIFSISFFSFSGYTSLIISSPLAVCIIFSFSYIHISAVLTQSQGLPIHKKYFGKEVATMAYINGTWLDREARAERIELVTETLRKLSEIIKSGKGSSYHYDQLRIYKDELKKLKRVHRAEVDMLYFFYEYFSEARNPGNPDNLVPTPDVDMDDAPDFHRKLSGILDSVSNRNRTARIAWAASRGAA